MQQIALGQVAPEHPQAVELRRGLHPTSSTGLEALGDMTGLASTYLTVVHTDDELQEIRYALNTRDDFERCPQRVAQRLRTDDCSKPRAQRARHGVV